MEGVQNVNLPGVLSVLEGEKTQSPVFFINPTGTLETFFTYKGCLVEVNKMQYRLQLGKATKEQISEEIRVLLTSGLQRGDYVVFYSGQLSNFNFAEFFSQFDFNKGDQSFFDNGKLFDKAYLISSGILTPDLDKDYFGAKGSYAVNASSRVVYLCKCEESEISTVKANSSGINFNYYLAQ